MTPRRCRSPPIGCSTEVVSTGIPARGVSRIDRRDGPQTTDPLGDCLPSMQRRHGRQRSFVLLLPASIDRLPAHDRCLDGDLVDVPGVLEWRPRPRPCERWAAQVSCQAPFPRLGCEGRPQTPGVVALMHRRRSPNEPVGLGRAPPLTTPGGRLPRQA